MAFGGPLIDYQTDHRIRLSVEIGVLGHTVFTVDIGAVEVAEKIANHIDILVAVVFLAVAYTIGPMVIDWTVYQ